MNEPITLYAVSDFPWDDDTKNTIISRMIKSGYRPLNGIPFDIRDKTPYLCLHFISRFDVPGIKNG